MFVLLHGFLGQKEDWSPLVEALHLPCEALILPGHHHKPLSGDIVESVYQEIQSLNTRDLIGYSAGGRLALQLKMRYPHSFDRVIILSAHPGLKTEEEKQARFFEDQLWSNRFRSIPLEECLKLWYNQTIFSSLRQNPELLKTLHKSRLNHNPQDLAAFLESFSLAKQPTPLLFPGTLFLYGTEDLKMAQIYHTLPNSVAIPKSGHLIHLENPICCAEAIKEWL